MFSATLGPPYCVIGATIRIGQEMLCLPYAGFSSNRPTGPIRSSSRDVRPYAPCLFVPFHVLDFEAYFAPTSRSRMSNIFRDSESLGKKLERSGLRIEHFCWKVV